MPIMKKEDHNKLTQQVLKRVDNLLTGISGRPLKSAKEGAGRGTWRTPEEMTATTANKAELMLLVNDFESILSYIKRLK